MTALRSSSATELNLHLFGHFPLDEPRKKVEDEVSHLAVAADI